jgi:hypothetical protein
MRTYYDTGYSRRCSICRGMRCQTGCLWWPWAPSGGRCRPETRHFGNKRPIPVSPETRTCGNATVPRPARARRRHRTWFIGPSDFLHFPKHTPTPTRIGHSHYRSHFSPIDTLSKRTNWQTTRKATQTVVIVTAWAGPAGAFLGDDLQEYKGLPPMASRQQFSEWPAILWR